MGQLKELLLKDPALRKLTRKEGSPIFVTMDTNMTDIGWVINQENEDGIRYPGGSTIYKKIVSRCREGFRLQREKPPIACERGCGQVHAKRVYCTNECKY